MVRLSWVIFLSAFFSCNKADKPTTEHTEISDSKETAHEIQSQKEKPTAVDQFIYTTNEYADTAGHKLTIVNSFPKGGLRYSDPYGKDYVYTIFWTQITSNLPKPTEIAITFPVDSIELSADEHIYFKLLLPDNEMTLNKASMFNYGLETVEPVFGAVLNKPSTLTKTIKPGDSIIFYVATLFNKGVQGVVRTEFFLRDNNLYYKVNDTEIYCGEMSIENLKPI
ncbi:hypothetical protein E1176_08000 [Fulvivirga sp. RKSG066]|uniref:hypothetical protein n=1 Tax=Fulvivirga aurantia TaxID=2529383 RepID=UPI0012BCD4A4|nr:hypothetical protein [Fulvivirga aurantia]MTI20961.1 hypothetical protein [Fulvivirga aurantia]